MPRRKQKNKRVFPDHVHLGYTGGGETRHLHPAIFRRVTGRIKHVQPARKKASA